MGENKHTPAEDPDRLVNSLVERAGIARSEGNATATADAWHFEQAAAEITRLRAELADAQAELSGCKTTADLLRDQVDRLRAEVARKDEALAEIADPVAAMKVWADKEGARIDGSMANFLANDVGYLKGVARAARIPAEGRSALSNATTPDTTGGEA